MAKEFDAKVIVAVFVPVPAPVGVRSVAPNLYSMLSVFVPAVINAWTEVFTSLYLTPALMS